jgi:hypothetical protein
MGTSVPYLPGGYEEVNIEGITYMKLGTTHYRPYYEGDEAVYVVTRFDVLRRQARAALRLHST